MSESEAETVLESSRRGGTTQMILTETSAYRGGWRDGRFGAAGTPHEDSDFSGWEGDERRAYCRGYREGLRVRSMLRG